MDNYEIMNNAFKTACKVLFREEIGDLKDYEEWLKEYIINPVERERVKVSSENYAKNAKFIDYRSIDFMKKFEPLNINEIKDIDSIVEALKERLYMQETLF